MLASSLAMQLTNAVTRPAIRHNVFAYIGQPQDRPMHGVILGGYRVYRAELGIFLKQDSQSPFASRHTLNGFDYAAGNPIWQVYVSGHSGVAWYAVMGISLFVLVGGIDVWRTNRYMQELMVKMGEHVETAAEYLQEAENNYQGLIATDFYPVTDPQLFRDLDKFNQHLFEANRLMNKTPLLFSLYSQRVIQQQIEQFFYRIGKGVLWGMP